MWFGIVLTVLALAPISISSKGVDGQRTPLQCHSSNLLLAVLQNTDPDSPSKYDWTLASDTVSGKTGVHHNTVALTAEILEREETIRVQLVLATLLVALLAFFYVKYRKMHSRLNIVLQEGVEPTISQVPNANIIPMDIAPEVVQRILLALDQWESQKGYMDQGTSLGTLATLLGTNTSYLSKIINVYKGQTFSQYLRDLRITHAINHIKEHPDILTTQSTIQLAERFGFSSVDVFARAMKSKIGLTPGLFFRKVRQKHR
ncbi:helix-turn-helix transcriptional regulator [Muricauda sp. NFXS6]|uniref:helix-turn-helix domain-containing protein n=1 Tax=Allomuricauda sp. NFXS6 TaxID=2819094 RepID=UPI0032DF1AA5